MSMITWAVVAVFLICIELATVTLTTIWFALGSIGALIVAACGGPMWLQLAVFIVISGALLVSTRPILVDKLHLGKNITNVKKVIGRKGIVVEEVDNLKATGRVQVDGMDWAARSVDDHKINVGNTIEVREISGAKLLVTVEKNLESEEK